MVMLLNQLHNRLDQQAQSDLLLVDHMFPSMPLVMLQPPSLLLLLGIEPLRVLVLDLLQVLLASVLLLWGLALELTPHLQNQLPSPLLLLLGHQNQLDRLARTLQLALPVLQLRVHPGGKLALLMAGGWLGSLAIAINRLD